MTSRPVVSDPEVCGGSPRLAGTRLTCLNIVCGVRNEGWNSILETHRNLVVLDLVNAVVYCAGQTCKRVGVTNFCDGCTLDTRPSDALDEKPEDVWRIARELDIGG